MPWILSSLDGTVSINFNVDGNGGVGGSMVKSGENYTIGGQWSASGSIPGRNFSAFEVSGQDPSVDSHYIAAAGNMSGPGDWPWAVQIGGAACSVTDGVVNSFIQTLLPVALDAPGYVTEAYNESGCIIVLDASTDALTCTACYIGGQSVSTAGILTGTGPITINIPSAAPDGSPVCIVFGAPAGHFANPPLMEAHHQIAKVLFDSNGQAPGNTVGLVLQYFNGWTGVGRSQTQIIDFNHGRDRTHTSVVIRPT
ncbi:MAG: hypothetical protein ACKOQM_13130 [Novosphingobium sp.]